MMSGPTGRGSVRINRREKSGARTVKAIHGVREMAPDPQFELDLAADLRERLGSDQLLEAFTKYADGSSYIDVLMRRICLRALVKKLGSGVTVRRNVSLIHPETFEIGDRVFIGEQTIMQGRFDGRCVIGAGVWIGPQSYFDARDLVIEDDVGWGPGAKVLGSEHTGLPTDIPLIQTDLQITSGPYRRWGRYRRERHHFARNNRRPGSYRRRGSCCHQRRSGICKGRWCAGQGDRLAERTRSRGKSVEIVFGES